MSERSLVRRALAEMVESTADRIDALKRFNRASHEATTSLANPGATLSERFSEWCMGLEVGAPDWPIVAGSWAEQLARMPGQVQVVAQDLLAIVADAPDRQNAVDQSDYNPVPLRPTVAAELALLRQVRRQLRRLARYVENAEAATEAAKPEAAQTHPEAAEVDLTANELEALQALWELGATSNDRRRTLADIAEKAQGQADPELYKWAVSQLVHKGLAQTKRGRQGGVWLSTAGRDRVNKR